MIPRYLTTAGLIGAAVLVVLFPTGYAIATNMEDHNPFCASCHTQPETTYYDRSIAAKPVDLASWHTQQQDTRCIDCHSGQGVIGRIGALQVGAMDLLAFVTRTYRQPAPMTVPIGDINCTKCHTGTTSEQGFDSHFHAFLPRWQAIDPTAARCVDCHTSHTTDGDATIAYLNQTRTTAVCNRCHQTLGGG